MSGFGFVFGSKRWLGDFFELVEELEFDPVGELGVDAVGGGGMNGGVVDALFLGVVARKAGDDRNVAEGDGELVGDDAGDATVAVEEGVDADETIVKVGEETANLVYIGGFDVLDTAHEVAGEGVELVINFGAAAGNVVKIFVPWCAETDVVAARS